MENQNDKEGKINGIAVTICIIVGILIIVGLSSSGTSSQQSDNQNSSAPAPVTEASIAIKSKCATDGKAYYQDFYKQFTQVKSVWFDPQFHFNSKLNTCLVFISWNDTSMPITWGNDVGSYTQIVTSNGVVFDVHSNQAILQDSTVKTHVSVNGKIQETDTLSDYPYSQNIPNSDIADFDNQLNALMSQ